MSVTSKIRAYRRLSPSERAVAARAALALPAVALALRATRVAAVQQGMSRSFLPPRADPQRTAVVCDLVTAVADRHPLPANCLHRSLTLWWLLGREGITSVVRFGVKPAAEKGATPDFHAWVEIEDVPVNDRLDIATEFIPFVVDQPPPRLV